MARSLGSVARCRASKYEIVRWLWEEAAVPSIMYGLEVTVWSRIDMNRIEVLQNMTGRIALCAKRYVICGSKGHQRSYEVGHI